MKKRRGPRGMIDRHLPPEKQGDLLMKMDDGMSLDEGIQFVAIHAGILVGRSAVSSFYKRHRGAKKRSANSRWAKMTDQQRDCLVDLLGSGATYLEVQQALNQQHGIHMSLSAIAAIYHSQPLQIRDQFEMPPKMTFKEKVQRRRNQQYQEKKTQQLIQLNELTQRIG